jgi:thioredoxin-related protein
MNKKIIVIILAIIAVGGMVFFSLKNGDKKSDQAESQPNTEESNASIILFYGKGCPHCENVDKFIQENNIKERIQFDELEIFYDKDNAKLAGEKSKECGINSKELGVPFLWNNGRCFSGDVDIINFFKSQLGEQ